MELLPLAVSLILHDGREVPVIATYVDVIDGSPTYVPVSTDFSQDDVWAVRVNGKIINQTKEV